MSFDVLLAGTCAKRVGFASEGIVCIRRSGWPSLVDSPAGTAEASWSHVHPECMRRVAIAEKLEVLPPQLRYPGQPGDPPGVEEAVDDLLGG
jgi:hypothetical protein